MGGIRYVTGDATAPEGDGEKIIAHVCNDRGGWGSGFVVSLSHRDNMPERAYRAWAHGYIPTCDSAKGNWEQSFSLGSVQFIPYRRPDIRVANMVAQRGIRHSPTAPRAVDYDALRQCLRHVGERAAKVDASVHMPRIGCGLGGGDWADVEDIVRQQLVNFCELSVTVYDLPLNRL